MMLTQYPLLTAIISSHPLYYPEVKSIGDKVLKKKSQQNFIINRKREQKKGIDNKIVCSYTYVLKKTNHPEDPLGQQN